MSAQEVDISLTPSALLHCCAAEPLVFALDGGDATSWALGHAVIGFRPSATLRVQPDGNATLQRGDVTHHWQGDPFTLLERFRRECGAPGGGQGFASGVVVALSYDLRRWIERSPGKAPDPLGLPVLHAAAYDWLLSYAYADRRYRLASSLRTAAELREIGAHLCRLAARAPGFAATPPRAAQPDLSQERYCAAVRAILEYIAAGDVYQVNLAQRFSVTDPPPPAQLFAGLQRHPMPFAAYLDAGDFVVLSNSPECLLTLRDGRISTFPIKGTRPRGRDRLADHALAAALESSEKDRAEHVMIVDLERNDLGRICRTGSVRVDELARVHSFPSLHHLVSTVRGEPTPEATLADILRATFPGGSITGAPKVRAMEIIDELEPVARGFYTGAIGYLGADGTSVFSLLIRTAIATRGLVTYHAGGGIVADSVALSEYEETLLKAQPFFAALAAV